MPGLSWSSGGRGGQGGSPKVQEGPDVVVPGERSEHLQHFGHILLSTRQREREDRLYPTQQRPPSPPEHPGFFPPRDRGATAARRALACLPRRASAASEGVSSAPRQRWGTHHLSMVDPFLLFPRGYSSRQTNTPAPLNVPLRNSRAQPGGQGEPPLLTRKRVQLRPGGQTAGKQVPTGLATLLPAGLSQLGHRGSAHSRTDPKPAQGDS